MLDWLKQLFRRDPIDPRQAQFDRTLVEYLQFWGEGHPNHEQLARERFGFEEDEIEWVNQVLVSAALGTLRNYANGHDDPWFQAAWRLSQSSKRRLLRPLRKSLMPVMGRR